MEQIPSGMPKPARARDDIDWQNSALNKAFDKFLYPGIVFDRPTESPKRTEFPETNSGILILHEGLIEELVSQRKFQGGKDASFLGQFSQIVRTSGKGRDARQLNKRLPFCEYSAISSLLSPYSSGGRDLIRVEKILLAKSVLNCVGQIDPKDQR